jgi:hypothetical protein
MKPIFNPNLNLNLNHNHNLPKNPLQPRDHGGYGDSSWQRVSTSFGLGLRSRPDISNLQHATALGGAVRVKAHREAQGSKTPEME